MWCICNEIKAKVMSGCAAVGFISSMSLSAIDWCEDKWQLQIIHFENMCTELKRSFLLLFLYKSYQGHVEYWLWRCDIAKLYQLSLKIVMKAFKNDMLKRILFPEGEEVTKEWRKLRNEELYSFYTLPNIAWVFKSRRIKRTEHV
jgi:hypothetical protein